MPESTAPEATPERWVVTVTRLDLRRGSLMLPYRLSGRFPVGALACEDAATGETQSLTVLDERSVEGLGGMYEAHGVQVNDRIVLHVLDGPTLRVGFEKRARPARTDIQPSRWYSVHDDAPTVPVTAGSEPPEPDHTVEPTEPAAFAEHADAEVHAQHDTDVDDGWLVDDVTVVDAEPAGSDNASVPSGVETVHAEPEPTREGEPLDPFDDAYRPPSAPTIVRDRPPRPPTTDAEPFAELGPDDEGPLARLGRFTRSLFAGNPSNLEVDHPSEDDQDALLDAPPLETQDAVGEATEPVPADTPEASSIGGGWVETDPLWLDDEAPAFSPDAADGVPGDALTEPEPPVEAPTEVPAAEHFFDDEPDDLMTDGVNSDESPAAAAASGPDTEETEAPSLFPPDEPDPEQAPAEAESTPTDVPPSATAEPTADTPNETSKTPAASEETVPSWLEPWRDRDQDVTPASDEVAQAPAETDEAVLPSGVPVPDRGASEEGDLRTRIARFIQSPDMPMIARSDVVAKRFSLDDATAQAMLEDLADSPPRGLRLILVREGAWRIERTGV